MARLLLKGDESTVPNTVAAASSFSEAPVARLVNISTTTDYTVTIKETADASATTIGSFTILRGTSELIEKGPSQVVFVNGGSDVKACKVGFTN